MKARSPCHHEEYDQMLRLSGQFVTQHISDYIHRKAKP